MFPQLFIGKIAISTFGIFLTLGFLIGVFLVWRLSRAWDLDEEKTLDLNLLTFLGGLFGARLYFLIKHFPTFAQNLSSILLFNKLPGLSFWGSLLGGFITLYFFTRRKRLDFLQFGDIASVGVIASLILSDLGCFLGGCNIGVPSKLFFSVEMIGSLGKRFPIQAIEALIFLIIFLNLWAKSLHFHERGKILSLSLIYIGAVKFLLEPLKASHDEGLFLSLGLFLLGISFFYKVTKRSLSSDMKKFIISFLRFFTNSQSRQIVMTKIAKYWYNQKTSVSWNLRIWKKNLRRLNVRLSYKNTKLY